jgi:hypothetical protein
LTKNNAVQERGAGLIMIETPNLDRRVAEILSDPDHYFAAARARAWIAAKADIDADLAQRAQYRLNHHKTPPPPQPTRQPATTDPPRYD